MSPSRGPLFDVSERSDARPAEHAESTFEFLNRVAGDYWEHPRTLMQRWLDRLANDHDYNDIRQRFRSRDDDQFRSAFLELYLHESLHRAGYAVTVHPPVAGTSRRPDFLGERNGNRLYVEAIAPGATAEAKAAARRRAVLFDTVNRVGDPNFILWLDRLEEGTSPPAAAQLRAYLRNWLATLDPDSIRDYATAPRRTWRRDGWVVSFRAIPKKPGARGCGPNDRAIGVFGHGEASVIDDAPGIRKAIAGKQHAYGDLGAPFVVAVGTYNVDTDRWHATNAMYGQDYTTVCDTTGGGVFARNVQGSDGYFGGPPRWHNRNVSGVLVVNQLMPYYVQRAEVTMWLHPAPKHPVQDDTNFPRDSVLYEEGALRLASSATPALAFFGLLDPWPPGEPWPKASN